MWCELQSVIMSYQMGCRVQDICCLLGEMARAKNIIFPFIHPLALWCLTYCAKPCCKNWSSWAWTGTKNLIILFYFFLYYWWCPSYQLIVECLRNHMKNLTWCLQPQLIIWTAIIIDGPRYLIWSLWAKDVTFKIIKSLNKETSLASLQTAEREKVPAIRFAENDEGLNN